MKLDPDDPKLTAYALGELDAAERAALEADLDDSPSGRRTVEEIRETAHLLKVELKKEQSPEQTELTVLTDFERLGMDVQPRGPKPEVRRFPWFTVGLAASLIIGTAGLLYFNYPWARIHQAPSGQLAKNAAEEKKASDSASQRTPKKKIVAPAVAPEDKTETEPAVAMDRSEEPTNESPTPDSTESTTVADNAKPTEVQDKGPDGSVPPDKTNASAPPKVVANKKSQRSRRAAEDDVTWIDTLVRERWQESEVKPSNPASDGEYVRRAYLDIVGHIPTADEAKEYVDSRDKEKKVKLIERLLASEDYSKYWAGVWSNLLIGRRPDRNLNIDKLSMLKYLRDSFAENKPWNKMVFELVSATGGSTPKSTAMGIPFNGATNFMLAHMNDGKVPATSFTTRLFLGVQVQCTQCHDHPFNDRKQESFWGINAFFQTMRKQDHNDPNDTSRRIFLFSDLEDSPLNDRSDMFVRFDKRSGLVEVTPPRWIDGQTKFVEPIPGMNLRQKLAELIVDPQNKLFTQAIVNRMWAQFLGRGVVHPLDDLGDHNAPSNPELLERMAQHFQESNYDLKRLITWITLSVPYSLSSQSNPSNKEDDSLFSHYPLKQMSPEQFFDSLMVASKANKVKAKGWEQADKMRDELQRQFTTVFGNDENTEADSFNGTIPQALLLMNSDLMAKAISKDKGSFLRESVDEIMKKRTKAADVTLLNDLYLSAVSRYPAPNEKKLAMVVLQDTMAKSKDKDPIDAYQDIFWALLNSGEFVLNH